MDNKWYFDIAPGAVDDLKAHAKDITTLIPFWYGVKEDGTLADMSSNEVKKIASDNNLPLYPIIHNYSDPKKSQLIHDLLSSTTLRDTLIASIRDMAVANNYPGINIDFEFVPPEDRSNLNTFLENLYTSLKAVGKIVTISVPAELSDNPQHPFSGAFQYSFIAQNADQIYILAYDEHFSQPGPIASIGFVTNVLNYAVTVIPPEKIWLGMAVYGYDWTEGINYPRTLTYEQAVTLARNLGVTVIYDETAQESTYTYVLDGKTHTVWFEDSRSFSAKLALVDRYKLSGIAIWRLGQEDPAIWNILKER
ncbi:glycoside hydrolase family 18 [Thermoanaerobacter mathranii subsp. mathranii str. A3]|jgi:spore germination protein YaaH|uniref:Glycoside hydrolase family 18 n=2 Tax=Thermoanaerobacter TaxID=1754 RepID=D3T801_THEIA|nr:MULTISPECIES: glycosyl hydrolase family 18 protein [Thermoanaerobacter]ADD02083.1 glycoside hydrolase family 18 [Thermoanaerobacter italicus Ab9]ADH60581.1 glycoside hydrolase family 18 [Thermoanaerobacter mathranii subsp. mathranii str. A3]MBT1279611.1 glycoside hydrolase [Thermoanaerobacter sp. CM-CNRG TB177]